MLLTLEDIKNSIYLDVQVQQKRPDIYQIFAPFFYEDGDMLEIYLTYSDSGQLILCDYGATLMKLSYYLDNLDKDNTNTKVFRRILKENRLDLQNGNVMIDTDLENLSTSFIHYASTLSKISSLKYFDTHRQKSLFYEILNNFVDCELQEFNPIRNYIPLSSCPENKVDVVFEKNNKKIFLFGVKDNIKASNVIISCLEFKLNKIAYQSIVVYENFQECLTENTKSKILRNTDKQYLDLEQFKEESKNYLGNIFMAA